MRKIEISKFENDGFQIFENVISKEIILEVKDFLSSKIEESLLPAMQEIGCAERSQLVQKIGEITKGHNGGLEALSKYTRDALSGHFSLSTRLSQKLWEIPNTDKFQEIAKALLHDRELYVHMPPTARFVLPRNIYAGVPPHQDISYNKHLSNFVVIWVPLVDIDINCGGVTVFEGSGNASEYAADQSSSDFWRKGVPVNGYKASRCLMKAGDILALNKYVIHSSSENNSDLTRLSIDFRVFGSNDISKKHYLDIKNGQVINP